MKEKLRDFFRPNIFKIILSFIFISWHYLYSYKGFNLFYAEDILKYIQNGFGLISWSNFFVKNLSLVGVWFALAIIIYLIILGFETTLNAVHNFKVKQSYANQKNEDFSHLLKQREIFLKTHLLTYLLWTGAAILILSGFVFVSGIVETMRFSIFDVIFWQLAEGNVNIDYNNLPLFIVTFLFIIPVWYFYVSLINWVLMEGNYEEEKDKITEDHYAVIVEDVQEDEEEI